MQSSKGVCTAAVCWASIIAAFVVLENSPASAQFACRTTATDIACNNAGTVTSQFVNTANGTNQNATTTNSGTANGFLSLMTGGGNATAINSGANSTDIAARAMARGTATVINSGSSSGLITGDGVDATVINSGSNSSTGRIDAIANGGNAVVINSGHNAAISAVSEDGNVTINNSGVSLGPIAATTFGGGNATVVNSGRAGAFLLAGNNATLINSGNASGVTMQAGAGCAVVINSGSIGSTTSAPAIEFESGPDTLTDVVGGRVIGGIALLGANDHREFCRRQFAVHLHANADCLVLPATDVAYGGALGVDRAFGLRLGAFAGGGASREDVELSVQSINSTYAFGGGFDWVSQYLDFSLYGASISKQQHPRYRQQYRGERLRDRDRELWRLVARN